MKWRKGKRDLQRGGFLRFDRNRLRGLGFIAFVDLPIARIGELLPDVEQRLRLKILAVVPHIRRSRRERPP